MLVLNGTLVLLYINHFLRYTRCSSLYIPISISPFPGIHRKWEIFQDMGPLDQCVELTDNITNHLGLA